MSDTNDRTLAAPAARPDPGSGPADRGRNVDDPRPADGPWWTGFASPTLAHTTWAVAVDGADVYVGGDFTYDFAGMAGGTYIRVAWWDGRTWRRMGDGVNGAVHAIAVTPGAVYVGGDFTVAGDVEALHLARWDGQSWAAVAGGVTDPEVPSDATVRALVSDGATLYVGGSFTRAGDRAVRSLAALDVATGTWSDPGGGVGLSWSSGAGAVRALALDGTALYVGGVYDLAGQTPTASFARLDTVSGAWTAYGTGISDDGLSGAVSALAVDAASGDVVIGGRFSHADGLRAGNLAVLRDGGFRSLGDVTNHGGPYGHVVAVAVADRLYIGGEFTAVGNAESSFWAAYDGREWSTPGAGVDSTVRAMAARSEPDGGGVVVVGDFLMSGPLRVHHGGIWTGAAWRTFGQGVISDPEAGGMVHAIVPEAAGAYVGGLFDQAGDVVVHSVARWTGGSWDDMVGGVAVAATHGQVFAMLRVGADLYVAGRFTTAGTTVVNNIARWDGRAWFPLAEGVDGTVYALAVLGGRLYVAGSFSTAGTVAAGRLATWDPVTATWAVVGNNPTYDDDIRALAVVGGRWLVVGGDFHRFFASGRIVMDNLWGMALFDTERDLTDDPLSGYHHIAGTSRFGGTGLVNALQVIGDDVYVGGSFDVAGILSNGPDPRPGFPAANLAVWHVTDNVWESVDGADEQVHALEDVDGSLAVGGRFGSIGGVAASRVALRDRDTGTWQALGSGLGVGASGYSWAHALAQSPDSGLWVGGEFPSAGALPSANLAVWTATRRGG